MGIIVSVMRDADNDYDCTAGGISSRYDRLLVTNVDGPFDNDFLPRVHLVPGNLPGTAKIIAEDEALSNNPAWTMFGGNFAHTSDSRWHKKLEQICGSRQSGAVPIHDRIES